MKRRNGPRKKLTAADCRCVLGGPFTALAKVHGVDFVEFVLRFVAGADDMWECLGDVHGAGGVVLEAAVAANEGTEMPPADSPLVAVPLVVTATIGSLSWLAEAKTIRRAVRHWAEPGRLHDALGKVS